MKSRFRRTMEWFGVEFEPPNHPATPDPPPPDVSLDETVAPIDFEGGGPPDDFEDRRTAGPGWVISRPIRSHKMSWMRAAIAAAARHKEDEELALADLEEHGFALLDAEGRRIEPPPRSVTPKGHHRYASEIMRDVLEGAFVPAAAPMWDHGGRHGGRHGDPLREFAAHPVQADFHNARPKSERPSGDDSVEAWAAGVRETENIPMGGTLHHLFGDPGPPLSEAEARLLDVRAVLNRRQVIAQDEDGDEMTDAGRVRSLCDALRPFVGEEPATKEDIEFAQEVMGN